MITQGTWEAVGDANGWWNVTCHVDGDNVVVADCFNDTDAEANANLIVEAFNVYNDTGFTPKQLAKQKADLLAACKAMIIQYEEKITVFRKLLDKDHPLIKAEQAIAKAESN